MAQCAAKSLVSKMHTFPAARGSEPAARPGPNQNVYKQSNTSGYSSQNIRFSTMSKGSHSYKKAAKFHTLFMGGCFFIWMASLKKKIPHTGDKASLEQCRY